MNSLIWNHCLAAWLGLLCVISPCPLATNIAAIGFLSRNSHNRKATMFAGMMYSGGRILTYIMIGTLLSHGLSTAPSLSHFLQKYMNLLMGPLLIILAMILLGLLSPPSFNTIKAPVFITSFAASSGVFGAFLLGLLFAASFCPSSAALFFGQLLPMMLSSGSSMSLSIIFGLTSGLPVLVFAFLLSCRIRKISPIYGGIVFIETWLKYATGVAFLLIGIWKTWHITMKIP